MQVLLFENQCKCWRIFFIPAASYLPKHDKLLSSNHLRWKVCVKVAKRTFRAAAFKALAVMRIYASLCNHFQVLRTKHTAIGEALKVKPGQLWPARDSDLVGMQRCCSFCFTKVPIVRKLIMKEKLINAVCIQLEFYDKVFHMSK